MTQTLLDRISLLEFNLAETEKQLDNCWEALSKSEFKCAFCTSDAWTRVLEQASMFMRKESELNIDNKRLLKRIEELEKELRNLKGLA